MEIDGQQYSRDCLLIDYEQIDYIEQYKNLRLFFKEYVGEQLLNLFISYSDMETKYPIEIIDFRQNLII